MSSFHLTVQFVPVRAITCDKPGTVEAGITIIVEGVVCCVLNCDEVQLAEWP